MFKHTKLATLGLGIFLALGLTSCGEPDPDIALLEQALAIPTLAIKGNGQSLEIIEGFREQIDSAIIMLKDVKVYDEEADIEYDIVLSWSYDEATLDYWAPLKERTSMPGLITDTNIFLAIPRLPVFGSDPVDTALIATAHLNDKTLSKEFPITLLPELADYSSIPLTPLNATGPVEGSPDNGVGGKLVRVRGYFWAAYSDWDAGYIQNGPYGISLYKLSASPEFTIVADRGDYVEAVGSWATYGGGRQISYITRFVQVTPGPEAIEPTFTTVTEATWASLAIGNDGGLVHVEGLTFDADATGVITLGGHFTIKLRLGALSITVYLNYHNDFGGSTERRQALVDLFTGAVDGATVTFDGVLGWYNNPQLLPIMPTDLTLVPAD